MGALTDPCLPDSWNVYGAYAGLFAMLAALGMQLIEFLAHQRYRSIRITNAHLTSNHDGKECIQQDQPNNEANHLSCANHVKDDIENPGKSKRMNVETNHIGNPEQINHETEEPERVEQINETTGKPKKKKQKNDDIEEHNNNDECENIEHTHNHTEVPKQNGQTDIIATEVPHIESTSVDLCEASTHHHGAAFQDDGQQHKISTYLLELGIALHSVLIGLTLGTTTDSFVALFIALCFHQFFEAIALGAQIANLKTASIRPAISMIVFYSLTTPVGIAIGIGIHSGIYNPKSVSTLIVTGIFDSLAAGVLIYVALVNLITAEMGINAHAFYSLKSRLKFLYFAALYLGVAAMAVIGRWA
jgi:zinc transporter 1/2/3